VVATGVRELKSKMRGSLDIIQLVTFEYVEGREVNRLTGIHEKEKFTEVFNTPGKVSLVKRKVLSNVVRFIQKAVVGEARNEKLWESFLEGVRLLKGGLLNNSNDPLLGVPEDNAWIKFEIIWLIKILSSLGYWESGKLDEFSPPNFLYLGDEEQRRKVVEEINSSIKSTHLL
jgi:hypothetical protein